jgi:hypothetical protein
MLDITEITKAVPGSAAYHHRIANRCQTTGLLYTIDVTVSNDRGLTLSLTSRIPTLAGISLLLISRHEYGAMPPARNARCFRSHSSQTGL